MATFNPFIHEGENLAFIERYEEENGVNGTVGVGGHEVVLGPKLSIGKPTESETTAVVAHYTYLAAVHCAYDISVKKLVSSMSFSSYRSGVCRSYIASLEPAGGPVLGSPAPRRNAAFRINLRPAPLTITAPNRSSSPSPTPTPTGSSSLSPTDSSSRSSSRSPTRSSSRSPTRSSSRSSSVSLTRGLSRPPSGRVTRSRAGGASRPRARRAPVPEVYHRDHYNSSTSSLKRVREEGPATYLPDVKSKAVVVEPVEEWERTDEVAMRAIDGNAYWVRKTASKRGKIMVNDRIEVVAEVWDNAKQDMVKKRVPVCFTGIAHRPDGAPTTTTREV